jgi:hypothetical protein
MLLSYLKRLTQSRRSQRPATRPALELTWLRVRQLEDRTVPATLNANFILMGPVSYTANQGVNNDLTIAWNGFAYSFTDTAETINVTGYGASWFTGSGTNTVSCPGAVINAITVDLGNGSKHFTLLGTGVPQTIANKEGGTDTVQLGSPGYLSTDTLANVQGGASVSNPSGSTTLILYDQYDATRVAPT